MQSQLFSTAVLQRVAGLCWVWSCREQPQDHPKATAACCRENKLANTPQVWQPPGFGKRAWPGSLAGCQNLCRACSDKLPPASCATCQRDCEKKETAVCVAAMWMAVLPQYGHSHARISHVKSALFICFPKKIMPLCAYIHFFTCEFPILAITANKISVEQALTLNENISSLQCVCLC